MKVQYSIFLDKSNADDQQMLEQFNSLASLVHMIGSDDMKVEVVEGYDNEVEYRFTLSGEIVAAMPVYQTLFNPTEE